MVLRPWDQTMTGYVAIIEQQGQRRVLSQRQLCASCGSGTFVPHAAGYTAACDERKMDPATTVFFCDDCSSRFYPITASAPVH